MTDKERLDFLSKQRTSFRFIYTIPPYATEWYSEEECMSDRSLRRLISRIITRKKREARVGGRKG